MINHSIHSDDYLIRIKEKIKADQQKTPHFQWLEQNCFACTF